MAGERMMLSHADSDRPHDYVAGVLDAAEAAEFERHLLECRECQAAVREAFVLRDALAQAPAVPDHARRPARRVRTAWLLPVAAVLVLGLWLGRDDPVRALGRIDRAPDFEALPVRSASPENRLVDSAMALYAARDYGGARTLLAQAAAANPTPGVLFYLGVAALQQRDAVAAVDALRRAVALRSPYADDARYYLAKAWLLRGERDSAAVQLLGIPADARAGPAARALSDSIRAITR